MKLHTGIVSLKPVATVGVNFHIKIAWNLVQLEGSNAIIVRKWDILLNIANLHQSLKERVTDNKTDLGESNDEYLFTVNISSGNHSETQVEIGHNILIDSGASVNLLNHNIYQRIQQNDNLIKLFKTNARIFAYGTSTPLNLAGEIIATVTSASGTSITILRHPVQI